MANRKVELIKSLCYNVYTKCGQNIIYSLRQTHPPTHKPEYTPTNSAQNNSPFSLMESLLQSSSQVWRKPLDFPPCNCHAAESTENTDHETTVI